MQYAPIFARFGQPKGAVAGTPRPLFSLLVFRLATEIALLARDLDAEASEEHVVGVAVLRV
jgi:hypothetical protein